MSNVTRRADGDIAGLPALRSAETGPSGACKGVSLIELMVVLTVVVTCLGMALPALLLTRDDWVARQAASYVVAQMMLARSQAARYGAAVTGGMR